MHVSGKVHVDPSPCEIDDRAQPALPSAPMPPSGCVHCGLVHAADETCPQVKRARDKRATEEAIPIEIADTSPAAPSHDAPAVELFLERYRMEQKLGQGGMGEVWKAYDVRLNRHVAIKKVIPEI